MIRDVASKTVAMLALVAVMLLANPDPAAADGIRPTNFESMLTSIDPPSAPIEAEVVGGDAFVKVRARPGTTVEIPGYDREPYLRIDEDGSVWRNERSASTYVNATRSGVGVEIPDDVGSGDPRWVQVASDGTIAWHDHRIHWMLDEAPITGDDGFVQNWQVPLTVDGELVELNGTLFHRSDQLPWPALILAAAAAAAAVVGRRAGWRRAMLLAASALALAMAVSTWVGNPPGAEPSVIPIAVAVGAVAAAAAALVVRSPLASMALPLASAALLIGWSIDRIGSLWMPLLPGPLPGWADRVGLALVLGVAVAVAVVAVMYPEDQRLIGKSPSTKSMIPPAS